MAEFVFLPEAGTKIKEIEPSGAHTAAQSKEKGQTDAEVQNPAAAARLEEILREYGFNVSGLELEVIKETVKVFGKVRDQETREKVILALGNVEGISRVSEDLTVGRGAREAVFHTVERADSLETIAKKVLGDPQKSEQILQANAPMLTNGKEIYPGMVLRIPAVD